MPTPVTRVPPGYSVDLDRNPQSGGVGCLTALMWSLVGIALLGVTGYGVYRVVVPDSAPAALPTLVSIPTSSPTPTQDAWATITAMAVMLTTRPEQTQEAAGDATLTPTLTPWPLRKLATATITDTPMRIIRTQDYPPTPLPERIVVTSPPVYVERPAQQVIITAPPVVVIHTQAVIVIQTEPFIVRETVIVTARPTKTATPTLTPTPTETIYAPTETETATPTQTHTATSTDTPTATQTSTATSTPSHTPIPTSTLFPTLIPSETPVSDGVIGHG